MSGYGRPKADFIEEAKRIISVADERGIPLRLMGAAAVRIHSPGSLKLHVEILNRQLTDLDFMTYTKYTRDVRKLFADLNYVLDEAVARIAENRDIFHDNYNNRIADVFYDKLDMCHTINFKGRLEVDHPTIPLADIVLEKLQIVKLNEKDVKDLIVLFNEHPVGETDKDTINAKYIAKLLAKDWGFWYTATTNLKRLRDEFIGMYKLPEDIVKRVKNRVNELLDYIDKEPKTMKWKMRAKIGTSRKWYKEVEEVIR